MRRATKRALIDFGQQVLPELTYDLTNMVLEALKARSERRREPPIPRPVIGGGLDLFGLD